VKRHWLHSPDTVDRLAAEYVLGTLAGPARRRFVHALRVEGTVQQAVASWSHRLLPLALRVPPVPVDAALWRRIEARIAPRTPGGATRARNPISWWRRLAPALAPLPVAALATGFILGASLPVLWQAPHPNTVTTQLPASYVGVLTTREGRAGLVVSSLRYGRTVDLRRLVELAVPDGDTLVLWWLDAEGHAHAVAEVPNLAFASIRIPAPADAVFARAAELAVSIEPAGTLPDRPSREFVLRGPCGKLWPPPRE
jgi:anti-sigma-K factor RskA